MLFIAVGCSEAPDKRLSMLYDDNRFDSNPEQILATIKDINRDGLKSGDRYLYDFIKLKAQDKAYITHKTDSVILPIVEFYQTHPWRDIYPQALYYAGRVYNDMGDQPTSLRYFQKALNEIPANSTDSLFKGNVLSQIAQLLANFRLYNEALPYLHETGRLISDRDTVNRVYHCQLLGGVYMYQDDYDAALECLKRAETLSKTLPDWHLANTELYLASLYYEQDSISRALEYIRGIPDRVLPASRNLALASAADIYNAAGYLDTVYMFARELIGSDLKDNKKTGYRLLLSTELRQRIPTDSLSLYFQAYKDILEDEFDENDNNLIRIQQSSYNYEVYQRESEQMALKNEKIQSYLMLSILFIALLIICLMAVLLSSKEKKLKLWRGIDTVMQLRHKHLKDDKHKDNTTTYKREVSSQQLKERFLKELMDLAADNPPSPDLSLLNSEIHSELEMLIKEGKPIGNDSRLWERMEMEIHKVSPDFKSNLIKLTDGRLKPADYSIAILIKFGMTTSQTAILLSRTPNTISTRRDSLSRKIFDEKKSSKNLDLIIHSI